MTGEKRALDLPFACALGVAALLPRLVVALTFGKEAVWDGHYYEFGAKRIAEGFGYSDSIASFGGAPTWHPWCHYPVGYSAFLGFFFALFGSGRVVSATVDALVGASLAPLAYAASAGSLDQTRSKLAGVLVAVHPGLVLYSALVMSEELAALATLLAFVVATRARRPGRGAVLAALALGLGALVRPPALLLAPFLALVLPRRTGPLRRVLAAAALSGVALLPILPWTARNCRVMDGCALVSTNAGWNLAIGAFPRATGRFEQITSEDGCRVVTGQVQQDRCWAKVGVAAIRADPVRWLSLIPKKLGFTFDHESFAVEYLHQADPEAWLEPRRSSARDLLSTFHRWLLVFAAAASLRWPFTRSAREGAPSEALRRHRVRWLHLGGLAALVAVAAWGFAGPRLTFWPLAVAAAALPFAACLGARTTAASPPVLLLAAALVLTTIVTHAVFFGEDRYHVVASPALCILAAAAFRRPPPRALGA